MANATLNGLAWTVASGFLFMILNAVVRNLTLALDPFQVQFLRYFAGLVVMLPWIIRAGIAAYKPNGLGGQLGRGVVHTFGLLLWFYALPHVPLADVAAIGFSTPIFVMLGAAWFLGERMFTARWVAALIAFGGVLIVLAPKLTGAVGFYALVMLASAPVFAASYLITKVLTKRDRVEVIVAWQALTITVLTIPFALVDWTWPSATQWGWVLAAGILGSAGHYCMGRAFAIADISAMQSVKFLELVWATLLGLIIFSDPPSGATLIGGAVIVAATVWIARYEARRG